MKSARAWNVLDQILWRMDGMRRWHLGAAPEKLRRGSRWLIAGMFGAGLAMAWAGCSEEVPSEPMASETNVIVAFYQSEESFEEAKICLDGEQLDLEWGSEFTPERPFTHVRLSAQEGLGNPGPPRYLSMKAVYTDTDLYLLLRWPDTTEDTYKDIFIYQGPDLSDPIVREASVGGTTVLDTLERLGCEDSLVTAVWWKQVGDDDKIAIAWELWPSVGSAGLFVDVGCQACCHGDVVPVFGHMDKGRLDMWVWLAGRTDPIRRIFCELDDPDDATQGIPGYLDDCYLDALGGITPDVGDPGYMPNFIEGMGMPRWIYRRDDDPFFEPADPDLARNESGELGKPNNRLPFEYLWREEKDIYYLPLAPCDTLNDTKTPDAEKWEPGDVVAGYMLTYPSESRADVRGKGLFGEDLGIWTLELSRPLDTEHEQADDVIFEPEAGKQYCFTISVFDASTMGHWGSEPQVLVFGPKE